VPAAIPVVALASLEGSGTSVYLQLGAVRSQQNAEAFLEKMRGELNNTGRQFKGSSKDGLVRVHIGPYGSESEARSSARAWKASSVSSRWLICRRTTTALADTALKNGSKSSCTKMYIPVSRHFLPCLSCARYVVRWSC